MYLHSLLLLLMLILTCTATRPPAFPRTS